MQQEGRKHALCSCLDGCYNIWHAGCAGCLILTNSREDPYTRVLAPQYKVQHRARKRPLCSCLDGCHNLWHAGCLILTVAREDPYTRFWHHRTKCNKEVGSIPCAAAWMAATTSGMLAVLSSQLREKTLTLLSDSRWIWARVPSYLYSARKGAPLSCLMASGMPSLIFANMGFNGTPAVSQSCPASASQTNGLAGNRGCTQEHCADLMGRLQTCDVSYKQSSEAAVCTVKCRGCQKLMHMNSTSKLPVRAHTHTEMNANAMHEIA